MGFKISVVLCDFDGTIAADVLFHIFQQFARTGWEKEVEAYNRDKISARELYRRNLEGVKINPETLRSFLNKFKIDSFFPDFTAFCKHKSLPLYILSDGLDFYIDHLLQRHGLSLPYFSNKLVFDANNQVKIDFPCGFEGCSACGNCKLKLRQTKWPGEHIAYIGDGYSDRCVAESAQVLFATKKLALYCEEKSLTYFPFENFQDIQNAFQRDFVS